jgi:translation initiation factor IF-2
MRVSELAKELGYKAAELVELAKAKGIKVEDARANIDARLAAAVRAQVPHRSKLSGPLMDIYTRVVTEEAARAAAKAAEPKSDKPKKEPTAEGTEAPKTKRVTRKKEAPAAGAPAAEAGKPGAKKEEPKTPGKAPVKKAKVAMEFRLGATDAKTGAAKPADHKHVELTPEEQEEIKKAAATPLIDVDKVIGEAKELHAMRPIEIEVFTRDKEAEESKEKRHVKPVAGPDKPAAPVLPPRPTPTPPRPGTPAYAGQRPPMPPPSQGFRPRTPPSHHPHRPTVQPPKPRPVITPMAERKIEITVPITIKSFCEQTGIKVSQVIKKLMDQGAMVMNQNAALDEDMVGILAAEFKRDITIVKEKTAEEQMKADTADVKDDPKDLVHRAPVVTFMGHVDHGKTSLLDKIRNTDVAKGESGGITQHIGASKVTTKDGKAVVFLDTPGHEAFTQMRSRGAKATDVAVIVVDAADGVMPQTEEAINHAKAAGVTIVVALNKIDKPQANPMKVKGQLSALGVQVEEYGGTTGAVEVSALTGQGVDSLLERLALEAEILDLKANPKRKASGVVLEARKTDDRGVVATILVQNGTLKRGDVLLAGKGHGRVRSMTDHQGKTVEAAGPATPVELMGLAEAPDAGDVFQVVDDIQQAKEIATSRATKAREAQLLERQHVTMEGLFKQIESGKLKEIRIVLKVDVQGSLQVLKEALPGLSTDEVKLKLLHASVGAVTEGDVLLADASDALIIGFHVDVEPRAAEAAKDRGVEIKVYTVIYQAIEEMKAALEGLLEPELVERAQGTATVKEVFRISRVGAIAGCIMTKGKIERTNQVRLIRDGKVVHSGKLESLKRFKDDVKEVVEGYECGIKIAGHDDVRPKDVIEAFAIEKVARKLEKKQK